MKIYLNYGWASLVQPKYWHFNPFTFRKTNGKTGYCLWLGPFNISI
jgi:hypothetical protein